MGNGASMLRRPCLVALVAAALAGCGGRDDAVAPQEPRLPRPVGETLAARSVAIADLLDQGDDCRARAEAVALRGDVREAVESQRIPEELRPQLEATADRLLAEISCVEAPPVSGGEEVNEEEDEEADDDKEKKPKKDKEKKDKDKEKKDDGEEHEREEDAPPVTEPEPTETTEPTTTQEDGG